MEEQLQRDGWASRQMPGSGGDRVLDPHTARTAAMHCQRREVEVGGTAPFTAEGNGGEGGVVDGWVLSTAVGDMDIGVGAGAGMAVREGVSRGDCAVQQVSSFTALQRAATTTAAATSAGYHSTTSSIVTAAGYSSSSGGGGGGAGSVLLLERYVAAVEERNRIGRAKLQQARRAVELQVRGVWVGGGARQQGGKHTPGALLDVREALMDSILFSYLAMPTGEAINLMMVLLDLFPHVSPFSYIPPPPSPILIPLILPSYLPSPLPIPPSLPAPAPSGATTGGGGAGELPPQPDGRCFPPEVWPQGARERRPPVRGGAAGALPLVRRRPCGWAAGDAHGAGAGGVAQGGGQAQRRRDGVPGSVRGGRVHVRARLLVHVLELVLCSFCGAHCP